MNNQPIHTNGSSTAEKATDQSSLHRELYEVMEQLPKPDYDWRPLPPGLSEEEALSLATPEIILFANWSDESHQALQEFERGRIGLQFVVDSDAFRPRAVWANNIFEGLDQIRTLLMAIHAMQAQIIADMDQIRVLEPSPRNPLLAQWMTKITDRQLSTARRMMDELRVRHRRDTRFHR